MAHHWRLIPSDSEVTQIGVFSNSLLESPAALDHFDSTRVFTREPTKESLGRLEDIRRRSQTRLKLLEALQKNFTDSQTVGVAGESFIKISLHNFYIIIHSCSKHSGDPVDTVYDLLRSGLRSLQTIHRLSALKWKTISEVRHDVW